jgi:L-alanine-DL-glutamate epimerase-like enolase superfamily enzyme
MSPTVRTTVGVEVDDLDAAAYTISTDAPEADGTLSWEQTTLVVAHARAGDAIGLGYTYTSPVAAALIRGPLADVVRGLDAHSPTRAWRVMSAALRNIGRPGLGAMALSAVDIALWDLKARLLEVSLCDLLGAVRDAVPVYGSGGFTSYTTERLAEQLGGWASEGMRAVKMKIGSDPEKDPGRVAAAREAIGQGVALMVDANGAYERVQALALAEEFASASRVSWLEEPVSSQDLRGLRWLRERVPSGVRIAAGEYGDDLNYFRQMLDANAVDVLQADITRCGGLTELLRVDALCRASHTPLSLHCAPGAHLHAALALDRLQHLEYFHDHVRIEHELFDGTPRLADGNLWPDRDQPGHGLQLRGDRADEHLVPA